MDPYGSSLRSPIVVPKTHSVHSLPRPSIYLLETLNTLNLGPIHPCLKVLGGSWYKEPVLKP